MKTRDHVHADKLRGGFYTPDELVDLCLSRVEALTLGRSSLRLLEPSVGDGAFIRGLCRSDLTRQVSHFQALEVVDTEAAKSSRLLADGPVEGSVRTTSAIEWAASAEEVFDAAIGNPPFVRFQFVNEDDRRNAGVLAQRLGISFTGVSNLWLPVLLGALSRLSLGGAFAFVVPAECFTGISAGVLREWLVRNTSALQFDLFPPGSFPEVLQEVVVLSGRVCDAGPGPVTCTIREHGAAGQPAFVTHRIPSGRGPWTKYLLSPSQIDAFSEATELAVVFKLGLLARFEVAAVTGANSYFSVDSSTLASFDLDQWSRPLLPRLRHAPGLRYTAEDHAAADAEGARVHLLDFSGDRADPESFGRPSEYLSAGVESELNLRYKCRIREPWYRVPFIRAGEMMLSKRSHHFPRVVLNDVGVVTTDTIYRGTPKGPLIGHSGDLVASFHNSLTLLSAELEGRSFGGGVLELVPSEVSRLVVPHVPGFAAELERLDAIARVQSDGDELVEETDLLLTKADVGLTQDLLERLADARLSLLQRRLDRNAAS